MNQPQILGQFKPIFRLVALQNRLSEILVMRYHRNGFVSHLIKTVKPPSLLRKELVSYAISYGNKKAAQQFQTTVKTVRKWRTRWEEKKGVGLKDLSKKPKKSPRIMKPYWQFKIKDIAEKASADNKRINGAMIKREYSIPYSAKTLVKYLKQYYKLPINTGIPSLFISQNFIFHKPYNRIFIMHVI